MADDIAEPAQTDQVQGDEAAGGSPWESYLTRFPEEARDEAATIFKEMEGQTTRRFQEAAEYRKGWEPFEELGVNQRDPQAVKWAMDMLDAATNNPAAVQEWFQDYAKERGLTQEEQQRLDEFVDPSVTALMEQQLSSQLGPVARQLEELSQWRTSQEQQAREQQALQDIKGQMDGLKAKHGAEFNEPMVEKFIANYVETDPQHAVERAFQDWQAIRNQIEKDALQSKADAPLAAESGGGAAGSSDNISTLKQAADIALEQLRANRNT